METARILGSLIGISKLNNFEEINNELIPIIEKEICQMCIYIYKSCFLDVIVNNIIRYSTFLDTTMLCC